MQAAPRHSQWGQRHWGQIRWVAIAATLVLLLAPGAAALEVAASFVDLPDETPGQDLWQAEYQLGAFPHGLNAGYEVLFDAARVRDIGDPEGLGQDWDGLTLAPDTQLPDYGRVGARALVASPSLSPLRVRFVWLGTGPPSSQTFVVHDAAYATLEEGSTLVPEPAGLALAGAAGLALCLLSTNRPDRRAGRAQR